MRNSISFYLNGIKKEVKAADAFLPLSSYLRYDQGLTGTKVVCAEGDCGACTVLVAKWNPDKKFQYQSINSCITLTASMDGANIVTVEALAEMGQVSEVQCSMIRNFGGQCGFCTPGFVMSITNMYEHKTAPTEKNVKNYLTGNLCRCTGYSPIIQAALDVDIKKHISLKDKFPPRDLSMQMLEPVLISDEGIEYFAPITLQDACNYRALYPEAILFSGATDLGVQINKGHLKLNKILSLHLIPELYEKKIENIDKHSEVIVGACVTLSEFQELISGKIDSLDRFLNIFASPQIKNKGTLIGNLANASPIADMTPVLMALDAELEIVGPNSHGTKNLKDFYLGYKKLDLQKSEIITKIRFKVPESVQKIENYKIAQRRDLDISSINASFNFTMKGTKIINARMAFGGVAATPIRLTDLEKKIEGMEIGPQEITDIKKLISNSIHPLTDLRGSSEYRKLLAASLFEKYVQEVLNL